MSTFSGEYLKLNSAQKEAVDRIEGPLLVLAGPGTGKTQLLSARVANILSITDSLPQNILCLTFTENGAANMRERLIRFIGQSAYDVNISTYHALGGDLIRRFPEYFARTRLENPVDELIKREIIAEIVNKMSYSNPLKQTQHYLGDLISTISEVKRGLLDEESLRQIAQNNSQFISAASLEINQIFKNFVMMPGYTKAVAYFEKTLLALQAISTSSRNTGQYMDLKTIATSELEASLQEAESSGKTSPLTSWKNTWLAKNSANKFVLAGELQNKRIEALADVFTQYQKALEARGLYDFDDMILRSIKALQTHPDLKYTLQEQYLYILLDEFQDTNAAQFELVKLLSDNPVHEGKPNIMAVGDDDQAIYAFQGAHYSNMVDFYEQYKDVALINLTQNYRSHPDILFTAGNIASQIEARLHHNFENFSKDLISANESLPKASEIQRHEFASDIAQCDWIAADIEAKVKKGIKPSEIAVLAPRHKQLEQLVAYLNQRGVAVNYEKRENILETSSIKSLVAMSRLVEALAKQDEMSAAGLWPQVLSYDFWQIPVSDIWKISWLVNDSKGKLSWSNALLNSEKYKPIALLFLAVAGKYEIEIAESMLDYLIGTEPISTNENSHPIVRSPMREYYSSPDMRKNSPQIFYEVLSHLSVIRAKLRDSQATQEKALLLRDFLDFINLYELSETRMINSSPYKQSDDAVQLMTVFKAKGQEFEHVYLPACIDEVWGESSRGNNNKLTLPPNLAPIRHAGATQDERLRIFFVALTRAKVGLYLTSYKYNYAGKATKRLKYLNEQSDDETNYQTMVLPDSNRENRQTSHDAPELQALQTSWQDRHISEFSSTKLRALLDERLAKYQLSPTHLNSFYDLEYAGPEAFFFNTILRFPSAPTPSGQFGNAIHELLHWFQLEVNKNQKLPSKKAASKYFEQKMTAKKLNPEETKLLIERGTHALDIYLSQREGMFTPGNIAEHDFRNEGVFARDAHLSGKIDLLEIDKKQKTINVVDYKTGGSFDKWSASVSKLHKYKQQLYIYKLLIEGSHSFKGYEVTGGRLEFVEPNSGGEIQTLSIAFNEAELSKTKALINAMWQSVKTLNLPDVSAYETTFAASKKFENDTINNAKNLT
ncbi:ATP-dependent helicase [Candidatus Parcubacteria bacterium]|nr:ATP-dependent helicase [Candidatus Parcubacteria bacterium]